jgi:AraC-like DNA-binding protein
LNSIGAGANDSKLKLYIKYMASIRCKMIVKAKLDELKIPYLSVNLGEVEMKQEITKQQREQIKTSLLKHGLELMDDKKAILIEKIKNVIIEMIHYADEIPETNFSGYLSQKLNRDYTYLSNLFSETEAITIERFLLIHKIEKIKELIIYDELSFTDIAFKLNYNSVGHLSNQFKKITGLTPSFFRSLKKKRIEIERTE